MNNKILFDWIKLDDNQLDWLSNYLRKKIPSFVYIKLPYTQSTIDTLINEINRFKKDDSLILFMNKTKAAWNQYQRRDRRKKSHVTSTLEIKKYIYKQVVEIAKKYRIPTNIAIEELIKKSCAIEKDYHKQEKTTKKLTSIKNEILKNNTNFLSSLKIPQNETISNNILIEKLTSEMYENYCLKLQLIELSEEKSKSNNLISTEKEKYIAECEEYNINCLLD